MIELPEGRTPSPRQRCEVWVMDVQEGCTRLVFLTHDVLLEAPNWLPSGEALLLNADGKLFQLRLETSELCPLEIKGLPSINNDHVVDRLGQYAYLSADDGHIYQTALNGECGVARRISERDDLMHFLHGIHPTEDQLAFIGVHRTQVEGDHQHPAQVYAMSNAGTDYRQLTDGDAPADGCEYSPDGQWIYFNTEAFDGHMQIGRMRCDGTGLTQLTFDQCSNWFPHVSLDGRRVVYLAYAPGTAGHPGDVWVDIRLVEESDWRSCKTIARVYGGQGTMNVNSWSPDGRCFAYIAYGAVAHFAPDSTTFRVLRVDTKSTAARPVLSAPVSRSCQHGHPPSSAERHCGNRTHRTAWSQTVLIRTSIHDLRSVSFGRV